MLTRYIIFLPFTFSKIEYIPSFFKMSSTLVFLMFLKKFSQFSLCLFLIILRISNFCRHQHRQYGLLRVSKPCILDKDSNARLGFPASVNSVFKVSEFNSWAALAICKPSCSLLGETVR